MPPRRSKASDDAAQIFWVVVLGDFGRSPRMQFHAQSLASRDNVEVHVIAYGGAAPLASLTEAKNVHLSTLPEVPRFISMVPLSVLRLALKAMHQLMVLLWFMLVKLPRPKAILTQNPPAIPSLLVCHLAALRHRCDLVIDWHNFAFSIMAMKHSKDGAIVRAAKAHEAAMGRCASAHFCVTRAMKEELTSATGPWRLPPSNVTVLYDRPPARFKRTSISEAHDLLVRISGALASSVAASDFASDESREWGPERTILTCCSGPKAPLSPHKTRAAIKAPRAEWLQDRPAVLVSSTSWTPDEDFGILLDALVDYNRAKSQGSSTLPDLLCIITGKGPQRESYLDQVAKLKMRHVAVRSLWLEPEDYPLILGLADIGVSLHSSSSGLDLPMKIVDMFGSGLPVLALKYNCIGELVEEGKTGLLFSSSRQLSDQLQDLLSGGSSKWSAGKLGRMGREVEEKEMKLRWEANWDSVAWPVLRG